jgi:hypothetical protein
MRSGGAIGQLLATDLYHNDPTLPMAVITFGQPRTLSKDLANRTMESSYYYGRVVNVNDPVPTANPRDQLRHCGECYYYKVGIH